MITVQIANFKGGVGKTTCAVILASALAGAGYKVVLVDTDPQGNCAKWFDMPEESGIYDLLIKEKPAADCLRLVDPTKYWPEPTSGLLALLPGNMRTTTAGIVLLMNKAPVAALRRALESLASGVDFVILDTAPTSTEMMAHVYAASDFTIVPTQTMMLDANGAVKTVQQNAKEATKVDLLGIVPTRYVARTIGHRSVMARLTELFGDLLWSPIAQRQAQSDAPGHGLSIFCYAPPKHPAVTESLRLYEEFLTALSARGVRC